jgi:Skp family chaperone for outer membrane proteins
MIKKILLVLCLAAFTASANAEGVKVGVVNMQNVQKEAKVTKHIAEQQKDYMEDVKDYVEDKEDELKDMQDDLRGKQDVLSREALVKEITKLQEKIREYNNKRVKMIKGVQVSAAKAFQEIQKKYVDDILEKSAKEKGMDVLIAGDNAMAINKDLDITSVVVDKLNDKITKFKIDKPEGF